MGSSLIPSAWEGDRGGPVPSTSSAIFLVSRDCLCHLAQAPVQVAGETGGVSLANESIAVWKRLHIEGYTDPQHHARLPVSAHSDVPWDLL